jgi:hypothetical protein
MGARARIIAVGFGLLALGLAVAWSKAPSRYAITVHNLSEQPQAFRLQLGAGEWELGVAEPGDAISATIWTRRHGSPTILRLADARIVCSCSYVIDHPPKWAALTFHAAERNGNLGCAKVEANGMDDDYPGCE